MYLIKSISAVTNYNSSPCSIFLLPTIIDIVNLFNFNYKWVFLISVCRAKFGESRNLEKMIGTPPLDDQMNISLQKNVLNSLQPPKTASTGPKFCCSQKVSFLKGSFRCSPNHIQHWNMECHTPLERSRIAFYGYVNFWSPNQTIWWPGAFEGFWR